MQLNITTKYTIQILGFMAQNNDIRFTSRKLSETLNIPYQYLAKIMTKLTKENILISTQGKSGGYSISKPLRSIKIIDIIYIFDSTYNQDCVLTNDKCNIDELCIMHEQWQKPKCAIDDFFLNTTLYNLVEHNKMLQAFNNSK